MTSLCPPDSQAYFAPLSHQLLPHKEAHPATSPKPDISMIIILIIHDTNPMLMP